MNKLPEIPKLFYSTWGSDFYSEHWLKPVNCWMLGAIKFIEANIDLERDTAAIAAFEEFAGSDLMFIYPDATQRGLVHEVFTRQYQTVASQLALQQRELLCTYPVDPFKTLFIYATLDKPETTPEFLVDKIASSTGNPQKTIGLEPNYCELAGLHIYHQFFMLLPDANYAVRLSGTDLKHEFHTPDFGIPMHVVNQLKIKPKYDQSSLYAKLMDIWGQKEHIPLHQDPKPYRSKAIHRLDQLQQLLGGKSVAVFKYNKELYSLLRFKALSPYTISAVFDETVALDDASEYIHSEPSGIPVISDIAAVQTTKFDAVVLTCAINYESELPFIRALMQRAVEDNMPVVSLYDDILDYDIFAGLAINPDNFYCIGLADTQAPSRDDLSEADNLLKTDNVLAVFGTDTVQGKFTTQLYLREALKKHLRVSHWATEPTGTLLGADIGYSRYYEEMTDQQQRDYERHALKQLAAHSDLLVTGGQNSIIFVPPGATREENSSTRIFKSFLPRYVVLTVAVDTATKLVEESIAYIAELAQQQGITTQVVALAMMEGRKIHGGRWTETYFSAVDQDTIATAKNRMKEKFNLPLYLIPQEADDLALQIAQLVKHHEP